MIDNIRFVMLTGEDEQLIGTNDGAHATGVALNENNECVSISSQYWTERGSLCANCTRDCAWGGIVWTRPDYQNQGIFTMLFFWVREQAGINKTYISKNDPFNLLLADKWNLSIPDNIESLPALGNTYSLFLRAGEIADSVTTRFQADA